jgi:hypothetical protein
MKITASRLSEGNKIFPAEIDIEDNGLTVKIPGFLGGKTTSFSCVDISSVSVDSPMMGYSSISFSASGTKLKVDGFNNNTVMQIKQTMKRNYIGLLYFLFVFFFASIFHNAKAQWTPTGGPYGGPVTAFALSGSNILAGTHAGVYLSGNNGTTWTPVNTGLTSLDISSLAVSGSNIFAGTRNPYGGIGGIFISSNNGTTWTAVNTGLTNLDISTLTVSGLNIFAGTFGGGVFLSTNNGTSWTGVNNGLVNYIQSFAISGNNIFAGSYGGVYLSTNNGNSWTSVSKGLPSKSTIQSLAISGTNIFAGTDSGRVYLSNNNGTSWTILNTGLSTNNNIYSLAVSGSNIFAGSDNGVYLSNNNGTSWTAVNTGLTNNTVLSLTVSGTTVFAGTHSGIYLSSNNGTNWTIANTGLTSTLIQSLAVSGTNIFAGTLYNGVYLSGNNGTSWTSVSKGLPNISIQSLAISGSNIFAGTSTGVYLSNNNGITWTAVNMGLTNLDVGTLAASGTNIFAGTSGGFYLSNNNGSSWTAGNTGLTNLGVRSLAVSGSNIFAGTSTGVYFSNNNGASWTAANTGLENINVNSLAISGTNIFAGTLFNGVYLSNNNGTSWTAVNTGLTNYNIWSFAVNGTNIFAGTNGGVFASMNNGTNWMAFNTNLTNLNVGTVAISGKNIFCGYYMLNKLNISDTAKITINGPTTFCERGSVTLSSNSQNAGSNQWYLNGAAISGDTSQVLYVNTSGNYSLKVNSPIFNSNFSTTVAVTVKPSPAATIIRSSNQPLCQGDSVILTANTGASYLWSTGTTSSSLTVKTGGLYSVNVTYANGCSSALSGYFVGFSSVPATPTIAKNGSVLMSSSSTNNQWYFNGTAIVGATSYFFTPTQNGNYTVGVNNSYGCSSYSTPYNNVITTGIQENELNEQVKIIPNPSSTGSFLIKSENKENLATEVYVINLQGQEVYRNKVNMAEKLLIDLQSPAKGVYYLHLVNANGIIRRKIIVQ